MRWLLTRMFSLFLMATGPSIVSAGPAAPSGAHGFTFDGIDGKPLPLSAWAGKVVLVVNTASFCGFTPQYKALQALWEQYEPRGLIMLGVPSNDFGGQEPGDSATITAFCTANYGVDFPMTAKVHVRGSEAHPLFQWLAHEGGFLSRPRWNFYKYLIGRDGALRDWFASITSPAGQRFKRSVEQL